MLWTISHPCDHTHVNHFTPVWPMLWAILHPCDQCGEPLYTSMTNVVDHFTPMWPVQWATLHQHDQCGEPLYTSVTNVVKHFTPVWPMWWKTLHQHDQCCEPLYTSVTDVVNHFTPAWPMWWSTLHQRDRCGESLYTRLVSNLCGIWDLWIRIRWWWAVNSSPYSPHLVSPWPCQRAACLCAAGRSGSLCQPDRGTMAGPTTAGCSVSWHELG